MTLCPIVFVKVSLRTRISTSSLDITYGTLNRGSYSPSSSPIELWFNRIGMQFLLVRTLIGFYVVPVSVDGSETSCVGFVPCLTSLSTLDDWSSFVVVDDSQSTSLFEMVRSLKSSSETLAHSSSCSCRCISAKAPHTSRYDGDASCQRFRTLRHNSRNVMLPCMSLKEQSIVCGC